MYTRKALNKERNKKTIKKGHKKGLKKGLKEKRLVPNLKNNFYHYVNNDWFTHTFVTKDTLNIFRHHFRIGYSCIALIKVCHRNFPVS